MFVYVGHEQDGDMQLESDPCVDDRRSAQAAVMDMIGKYIVDMGKMDACSWRVTQVLVIAFFS